MTDEPELVVKQVVPWTSWTKFQADQQSKEWLLIARDIDRGLAHDFDPAADYGPIDPSPPTEAECAAYADDIERMRQRGFGW